MFDLDREVGRLVFGETVFIDYGVPPGKVFRIASAHQVFMHPRDMLLLQVELCPTTYERKCTMRGQVFARIRLNRKQWTWPDLARWAGVPES